MSDRPTPASDETELREALESLCYSTGRYGDYEGDGWPIQRALQDGQLKDDVDSIMQLIAVAVQAESRKLLERLEEGLPKLPTLYERYEYRQGFKDAVRLTRVMLDSEQQKLGGKS